MMSIALQGRIRLETVHLASGLTKQDDGHAYINHGSPRKISDKRSRDKLRLGQLSVQWIYTTYPAHEEVTPCRQGLLLASEKGF